MEYIEDLSSEGNGHNTVYSGGEFEQKVLQSVDTSLEDAINAEPFLQSTVAMNTCSTQDVVGASQETPSLVGLPASMPGNLSIEGLDGQRHSHRQEELLADEKGHALEGTTEMDNVVEDHGTSSCAPPDQITLQEQGGIMLSCELLEDDSLVKMGSANSLHQGEVVEKSSVSVTCTSKVMDVEKVDSQLVLDMSSDSTVETHNSGIEVGNAEEDEAIKASAQDSVLAFPEKASEEAQFVNLKVSVPDIIGCNEEIEDTEHMAAIETECLSLQELHSELPKEIKKEGNVGSTNHAHVDNGASAPSIDNSEVAKAFMEEDALKNVEEGFNSFIHSEFKSLADAGESTESLMGDDGDVGNEIALDQTCLTRVDADSNGEDLVASGNVISTVEVSKGSLGESIEEDYASYDDEASKVCLSTTSSIRSITSQIGIMEEETLNAECSVDDANLEVNVEGGPLSQTEDAAASSECQNHGFTVDKDGGSSLDSTAGTGIQRSDEGAPVGDEEASSTGCEDTASSPACLQPLTHQRKKINIHHQFVREIVKIQHDREQYDREQAERQFQAQQAAGLPQIGSKSSDIKEQRSNSSEMRDVRGEANKQKGLKDLGAHKQVKDLQQKQSARNKQPSLIQSRNGPPPVHQWNSPNEQSRQVFQQAAGAKEQGKIGRGKQQQRSMSLYRPPVVRESLAAEQKNQGDPETSYHQSGAYAINGSPDSSASSFLESHAPIAGSPHFISEEGPLKAVRSSSEERLGDNIESQAELSAPGMGIMVTFDTEKKQRHIQLSGEPDSFSGGVQASPAASHSSSGYGVSKGRKFNPSLSDPFHELKLSRQQIGFAETPSKGNDRHLSQPARSVNSSQRHPFQDSRYASASRQIDHGETPSKGNHQPYTQGSRQQIGHGETPSKGNDRHSTQGARSVNPSFGHPFQDYRFSSGSRQIDHGAAPSKGNYDRQFTQAASSVNPLHQDSRFSPGSRQMDHGDTRSDRHFTQGARSGLLQGPEPFQNRGRGGKLSEKTTERKSNFFERADNSANLHSTSSWSQKSPPTLIRQGSDSSRHSDWYVGTPSPSSQSFGTPSFQRTPSREGELFGSNVRSEDYDKTATNMHANFQQQQFNTPRSHDIRGSQRYVVSNESIEGKREPHHRNSAKEYSSPFQAMMKEMSRPQLAFSSSGQRSADVNLESKGLGASRHAKDHTQMHSQDTSQESLRRSQSDASRKGYTQSSQAQATPLPSRESLFSTLPMQEKWGDIVDDLTDSYEYLQIKSEGDRDTQLGSLSYGASNMGTFDARGPKPVSREPKQDRGMPKYSSDLAREHLAYETPSRKSVFDRLGPQNNFQESILGPPPKMLDNRGVLKASPDALISNVPTMSTYQSYDSGFYGSQWAPQPQVPSMQHEIADNIIDEGREVVIQAYTEVKQRRSKRELYVPRRGS